MALKLKVLQKILLDEHTIIAFGDKNGCKNSIFINMNGIREFRKGKTKKTQRKENY